MTLKNWAVDLDLYCEPGWRIGLIGSLYLLGVITGLLVFIRASDIYGRKTFLIFTSSLNTIAYSMIIMYNTNLKITYVLIFFMGLSSSVRNNIGYVYGIELMPAEY